MSVVPYICGKKKSYNDNSDKIKDFSVFDFNYIPDEPFMREEAKQLIDEMLRFEMSGIPTHQAVIGSKGSGKTLTLKFLKKVMAENTDLNIIYANCRENNTSFKIFAYFLGLEARGASLSELYGRFCKQYTGKTVVLLDEIDLMSPKDKRRDILYFLSRSENPYMVIMLSNDYRVLNEIDPSTRSSLQPMPVYFKNYDAQQLQKILHQRAQSGLHSWQESHLAEIAALSTKRTNSDARVAIKTLFYTITSPSESIEACFEKARKDVIAEMINNLSGPVLMILQAIATSKSEFARDIYKSYSSISSRQNEKPFSYVHYYSHLSYLQSMGLVALIATRVGITYANRVVLAFAESILEPICSTRFG
jgi:archaeal cell division control protein 6